VLRSSANRSRRSTRGYPDVLDQLAKLLPTPRPKRAVLRYADDTRTTLQNTRTSRAAIESESVTGCLYVMGMQCTAPVEGHRSSAAAARCPACRGRSRYSSYSYSPPITLRSSGSVGGAGSPRVGSAAVQRSRRTRSGGSVSYTPSEWRSIEPLERKATEQALQHPERRDLFLCHAWDDREGSASELYDRLKSNGATVWFSEKDLTLGTQMLRSIDKGLRNSRVGIVLVTPALLRSIENEGIAEKELSVLLATGRVIPVTHGTTFQALRDVSPMLASHSGLDTAESSLEDVAAKIAAAAAALSEYET
jgi:TIR domain